MAHFKEKSGVNFKLRLGVFVLMIARLCIYKNSLVTGDFVAEEELISEILGVKEQNVQVNGFKAVVGEIQSISVSVFCMQSFSHLARNVIHRLGADQHC